MWLRCYNYDTYELLTRSSGNHLEAYGGQLIWHCITFSPLEGQPIIIFIMYKNFLLLARHVS